MSLLDDIRDDLVNESATLSNTLRKATILASAIGLPEFREWVDYELGGYPNAEVLPDYRRFRPTNLGNFVGPFQTGLMNMPLPTYNLPPEIKEFAENCLVFDSVGGLEALVSEPIQINWPQEMVMLARDSISVTGGMVLQTAYQPIPAHIFSGILDQVKNKLLDFILSLQESNITAEDLDKRQIRPDEVRNLFNINIYGDRNIVASGEQVSQETGSVQKGDLASLMDKLRELEVDDSDLSGLQCAVLSEPDTSDPTFGPKVRAWLGGMISKAATGTLKVGVETTSKVVTKALRGYYGC